MNCTVSVGLGWFGGSHYMDGCVCRVYPVLIWRCIGIFVFGYCKYMVIASVVLYFLGLVHRFFLHSLECSNVIRCWILGIYEFLGLLYCVD
jgi:hypothetical protein